MSSVVVAYSLTTADIERKALGSRPTLLCGKSIHFEVKYIAFLEVFFLFTRTCTTYITFFDVNFEHSNLQGPFCELLSHTTSLYLMIFVTGSYKK